MCSSGSSPLLAPTYDPVTLKTKPWVCVDARGNVTSPVFAPSGMGGSGLVAIQPGIFPNVTQKRFTIANNSGTNVLTLYTVPAGRRAAIMAQVFNASGGTVTGRWLISYDSGTTFRTAAGGVINLASVTSGVASFILEENEVFAIVGAASGFNIRFSVTEFDNSSPFKKVQKTSSWAAGDNTIYTCPSGKQAVIVNQPGLQNPALEAFVFVQNDTGVTVTYKLNVVDSGDVPAATNELSRQTSLATATSGTGLRLPLALLLTAGDIISINSSSANANQVAEATIIESTV